MAKFDEKLMSKTKLINKAQREKSSTKRGDSISAESLEVVSSKNSADVEQPHVSFSSQISIENESSTSESTEKVESQAINVNSFFTRGRLVALSIALLTAFVAVFLFRDSNSTGLAKMLEVAIFLMITFMHITSALKQKNKQRIRRAGIPARLMARRSHPVGNLLRAIVFIGSLIVFGGAAVFLKIAMEGSVAYDSGQYATAADRYSTMINMLNIDVYLQQRGNCYFKNGEYQKAVKDYTKALKTPTVGLYFARANSYEKLGDHNLAASDFQQGNTLAKGLGYEAAAQSLVDSEQLDDALKMYNTMIEKSPKSAKLYALRGHCFNLMERFQDAVSDYTSAISHYNNFGEAYYGRGLAYYNLDKESLAKADYAQAKRLGYKSTLLGSLRDGYF